ncbi:hypothetical protein PHYPSEUDO_014808 [Phytophthora pseudosyringae]|uniref:EF-hand domain-containing protein n=1 Tax=Phytophthora pseudosyringae TaxID=221518 RepID=A0A8T1W382_9STRA|nr:hypothetical protein PHYPSEUDO_014808 [Phytophthora pseudosyringae]
MPHFAPFGSRRPMAPTAKTSGDKTKKAKKSSRSSGEANSKDRERKSKVKDRKSSSKKDKTPAPAIVAPTTAAPPIIHDPDAIQLFRRYDRNRSGVLTRLDFLQLLRDHADPATCAWGAAILRPPLSLTDTSGIPLGYQRADRNSEFEAGQLFERYDRDHTGVLTLDTFHLFFADFKPQLRAFVEESNYRSLAPPPVTVVPAPPQHTAQEETPVPAPTEVRDAASGADDFVPSPKTLRAQYRSVLWKLRKMCKEDLFDQREVIVQHMKVIREEMASRQRQGLRDDSKRGKRRPRSTLFQDFDDDDTHVVDGGDNFAGEDAAKRYEAMEDDLDRLDELIRYVRRYLNKGSNVSWREMQEFIEQADGIEEEAQCLAMKDYGDVPQYLKPITEKENNPPSAPTSGSTPVLPSSIPSSEYHKKTDLEKLVRVKDQMIYQLLQERTALRKERAAVETSLKKLSDVSTREMKKWARLTDDMQAEIEQLRSQLRFQSQQRSTVT